MHSNPDFCLFLNNEQSGHTDPRPCEMTLPWCWQLPSDGTWTLLLSPGVAGYLPGPEGMWLGASDSLFSCLIELVANTSYALFGQLLVGISSKGGDFSIFRIPAVWALIPAPWLMSLLIGLMKAGKKLSFLRRPQMEVLEGTQWPHRGCISPITLLESWAGGFQTHSYEAPTAYQAWWKESRKCLLPEPPPSLRDWGQCPRFTGEESQTQERSGGPLKPDWLAGGGVRIRT